MAAKRGRLMHAAALATAAAVAGAGLSGCGMGKALGVSKNSPDEFAVVSKAPLVLPPDYELRPPKPGAERPQETNPTEAAKQALFKNNFGQPAAYPAAVGTTQLTAAGANPGLAAPPAATDNRLLVRKSESFANRLMFGDAGAGPTNDGQVQPASAQEPVKDKEKATITKKIGD